MRIFTNQNGSIDIYRQINDEILCMFHHIFTIVSECHIEGHLSVDYTTLLWRHNERDSVSNHQRLYCLLKRLFRRRSKVTSELRVTGLCAWNSPGTGEFPAQKASNAENVSIWWRHHDIQKSGCSHTSHHPLFLFAMLSIPKISSFDSVHTRRRK